MRRYAPLWSCRTAPVRVALWLAVSGVAIVGATSASAQLDTTTNLPTEEAVADDPVSAAEQARIDERRPYRSVDPYVEVKQFLSDTLQGGYGDNGVLTYTSVAVGVNANIRTHNAEVATSAAYERRFEWDKRNGDRDEFNGVMRARWDPIRTVRFEGGILANRARSDGYIGPADPTRRYGGNVGNVYAGYVGPTLSTRVGDMTLGAGYRLSATRLNIQSLQTDEIDTLRDVFSSSFSHAATASLSQRPGGFLPFGWTVTGGWEHENADQLAQHYRNLWGKFDVTVPVTGTVALVGGAGYERVRISQKDALRDPATGLAVRDLSGRMVTDPNSARQLAYATDGLIWDAGVLWQPSRRTKFTARVGERYGGLSYTGMLNYRPNRALALQIQVYDNLASFGRQTAGGLAATPTQFEVSRDPLTGLMGMCVFGDTGAACLNPELSGGTTSQFRERGVQALMAATSRGWEARLAVGVDRRRLFAPQFAVNSALEGAIERKIYGYVTLSRKLDEATLLGFNGNYYWYAWDGAELPDGETVQLSAYLSHAFNRRLEATLAAGVTRFNPDGFNTTLVGSAIAGLRYSFR